MTPQPNPTPTPPLSIPWWVAAIVIIGAVLTAAGGLFALVRPETLLEPGQAMNAAAHVYAGYLISRGLAVALMLLALLAGPSITLAHERRTIGGAQPDDRDAIPGGCANLADELVLQRAHRIYRGRLAGIPGRLHGCVWSDGDQQRRDALARRSIHFLLVTTTIACAALAAASGRSAPSPKTIGKRPISSMRQPSSWEPSVFSLYW